MIVFLRTILKAQLLLLLLDLVCPPPFFADTIYFKDGSVTVCRDRAWEQDESVKCEFYGTVVDYPKAAVDRIEPGGPRVSNTGDPAAAETREPTADKKDADHRPAPEDRAPAAVEMPRGRGGPRFYDPRRPQKYWVSGTSRHDSLHEAIVALARQYDRTPDWVRHHMGETNDLAAIHQNLSSGQPKPAASPETVKKNLPAAMPDVKKFRHLKFYDPRRPSKYWVSKTSHHTSLGKAVDALAEQYARSPDWIKAHMGSTNNLGDIHQNLWQAAAEESNE